MPFSTERDESNYACWATEKLHEDVQGLPNTFFVFGKCLKKATEYCLKFFFLFDSTIHPFNNGK